VVTGGEREQAGFEGVAGRGDAMRVGGAQLAEHGLPDLKGIEPLERARADLVFDGAGDPIFERAAELGDALLHGRVFVGAQWQVVAAHAPLPAALSAFELALHQPGTHCARAEREQSGCFGDRQLHRAPPAVCQEVRPHGRHNVDEFCVSCQEAAEWPCTAGIMGSGRRRPVVGGRRPAAAAAADFV